MAEQISFVDYLVLGDDPHLVANECEACGARFFDRRNACAGCSGTAFRKARVATQGELRAFTIVSMGPAPYVAGVVDCDGTSVRTTILNVKPDDEHVKLGMPVKLTTYSMGADSNGVEAISFGFEPAA